MASQVAARPSEVYCAQSVNRGARCVPGGLRAGFLFGTGLAACGLPVPRALYCQSGTIINHSRN
jgi:hypothetical protein